MKKIRILFTITAAVLILIFYSGSTVNGQDFKDQALWKTGEGNYKGYRIPAVIVSSKGTLIAFAEGRNEGGDSGDIDMVLKRSVNNGKSWENEILVWNDSLNTCGNPCPVVDHETGRIWLLMTWNYGKDRESDIVTKKAKFSRSPYVCYSDDDGITWSEPADLSKTCKEPSWGWYATGPGFGIQVSKGKYKGRLVIPANHSYDDPQGTIRKGPYSYGAHVLLSDDHGKSWQMSAPIRPGCNESQVTELSDGTLLMNMRSYNGKSCKAISTSADGGQTWSPITHDLQLVESVCQASILNYGTYQGRQLHLFSNPAVPAGRTHMTLKYSQNDCKHWTGSILLNPDPSAYSCLVKLPGRKVGILYETGSKNAYESIRFRILKLSEIVNRN